MSAPDTNIDKQQSRHRPSLTGIGLSVGFAATLLVVFLGWVFAQGQDPDGAERQIDGRTGAVVDS
ncbi:hypothetical protein [Antarctobacter jejuensis]|uniref:hypothetical protein n=1 Tax=Antarctobacter jejuensis TaxID=1439938 RepID=UPI003FD5E179